MKMNIKRMISSASFIKDVQPSNKKVGLFVRKHFWKIVVLTCVIDKLDDIVHYGWILPLYFFTDFLSDLCELFGVPRTRTNSIGIGCDSTPFLFKN